MSELRFKEGTPEFFKKRATAICERFFIKGICDPMYIANTIAYHTGLGNGDGQFEEPTEDTLTKEAADKAADYLSYAYSSNIMKNCKDELSEIIMTGLINPGLAKEGIVDYYTYLKNGLKRAEDAKDGWRVNYLGSCMRQVLKSKFTRKIYPHNWDTLARIDIA